MIPMELNAFKAQITNEVNQSTSIDELLDRLNTLFHTYSREAEEASWQHIPGLPRTREEVQDDIAQAEKEMEAGVPGIRHDELFKLLEEEMPWLK